MQETSFSLKQFDELSASDLYAILQLRAEVFVVEQNCVYQDLDGADHDALHVIGMLGQTLACYARLVPPGVKYETPAIGRVVTKQSARKEGLGKLLMQRSIDYCHQQWPAWDITISAQQHLERFYSALGFSVISEPYLEDDIPHIEMLHQRKPAGMLKNQE